MRGCHRQHGSDAVKPMKAWIFVKGTGCFDVVDDPEKIVDSVSILLPAQSVVLQRTAFGQAHGSSLADLSSKIIDDSTNFIGSWLLFFLWRHFAGIDAEPNLAPFFRNQRIREVSREVIETKLAFLLFTIVTMKTVHFEKCTS